MEKKHQRFLLRMPNVIELQEEDLSLIKQVEFQTYLSKANKRKLKQIQAKIKGYRFYSYLKPYFEEKQQLHCQRQKNFRLQTERRKERLKTAQRLFALGVSPIYAARISLDGQLLEENFKTTINSLHDYQCRKIKRLNIIGRSLEKVLRKKHESLPKHYLRALQMLGPKKDKFPCLHYKIKTALISIYSPAPKVHFQKA